jgi:hypothetical protein
VQSLPRYGDPVYHEQVLDILIYDEKCQPLLFENVRILPQEETPKVITGIKKPPQAILINANNKGYCRVIFNVESKAFFLKNLSEIKDDINRCNVWRILCDNMKIGNISGEELINCVCEHIIPETEEYTLPVVLSTVQWVLRYKFQRDTRLLDLQVKLFDSFFKKLSYCKTKSMEILILSEMLSIMSVDMDDTAKDWLKHKQIKTPNGKVINLEKPQRYQLLKLIYRSTKYSEEFKNQLLQKEMEINFSDFDLLE